MFSPPTSLLAIKSSSLTLVALVFVGGWSGGGTCAPRLVITKAVPSLVPKSGGACGEQDGPTCF